MSEAPSIEHSLLGTFILPVAQALRINGFDPVEEMACVGLDLAKGQRPQIVIPAGTFFGVELQPDVSHCLWGCTVAPGFDFDDFELAAGPELAKQHPEHAARIARMSRP